MEDNYRFTRQDIETAIDGEFNYLYRELNKIWWELSEASTRFSNAIQKLSDGQFTLARITVAELQDELPLQEEPADQH